MTAREPINAAPPRQDIRKRPLPQRERLRPYQRERSFIDFLPWVEYLGDHQAVLLEDGRSVGAVFEIHPIGTAGRTQAHLASVRDTLEEALQDSFEEYDHSPWVIQTYTVDDANIECLAAKIERYARDDVRDTPYSRAYFELLKNHYSGITGAGGLFVDETVTQTAWGGMRRRNYLVIYRKGVGGRRGKRHAQGELDAALVNLNAVLEKFTHALKPAGATLQTGEGVGGPKLFECPHHSPPRMRTANHPCPMVSLPPA